MSIRYKITPNHDESVVIWEHIDPTGMRRQEAAIVTAEMSVENIGHIQAAFDDFFGASKGHSKIIIQRIHSVGIEPAESRGK